MFRDDCADRRLFQPESRGKFRGEVDIAEDVPEPSVSFEIFVFDALFPFAVPRTGNFSDDFTDKAVYTLPVFL